MTFSRSDAELLPGFTLVEILLVVVLMSVMAGAVVVSLRGRQDAHVLEVTANDLAAAIRFAATEARLRGTAQRIVFSADHGQYSVERERPDDQEFTRVGGLAGTRHRLAAGVRIRAMGHGRQAMASLPVVLEFDGHGGGFAGWIELVNRLGETIRIEVTAETQQVYVDQ